MTPDVQKHLLELLEFIRYARRRGDDEHTNALLSNMSAALQALKVAGAMTPAEYDEWGQRASTSADLFGIGKPEGGSGQMYVAQRAFAAPGLPATTLQAQALAPRFSRLVMGPDEQDFYGGRLRILALEVYDTQVVVAWRVAPLPDPSAIAGRELDLLRGATQGLPEPERKRLGAELALESMSYLWQAFVISDDLGTVYRLLGSSADAGRSGNEISGRLVVEPSVAPAASMIDVDVLDIHFRFDLATA